MGVDCRISLPSDTRVDDVATVIGILAGNKKYWEQSGKAKWVMAENVKAQPSTMAECAEIVITSPVLNSHVLFFYEWDGPLGYRGMSPSSTPVWCAIAHRLVYFFGGQVDYNDCDTVNVNFKHKKPRADNGHRSDPAWDKFQAELWQLTPLTKADIAEFDKYASYHGK